MAERLGTVVFAGRTHAVGLTWRSLPEGETWSAARARSTARELGCDVYVLPSGGYEQAGFGRRADGHRVGMRSLALSVCSAIEGAFLGCWEVDEGWYLLAVREDRILPTTDVVHGDEEAAREAFEELRRSALWPLMYAPEGWGLRQARPEPLSALLADAVPGPRLVDATPRTALLRGMAAGLAFAAALGMAHWLGTFDDVDPGAALEEARRALELERERKRRAAREQVFPSGPWVDRPNAAAALAACVSAAYRLPSALPGWKLAGVSCSDSGQVQAALQRDGGAVSWVEYWLREHTPPGFVSFSFAATSAGATATWTSDGFAGLRRYRREEPSAFLAAAERALRRHFDDVFVPVEIRREQGPPQSFLNAEGDPETAPLWSVLKVSFSGQAEPLALASVFAALPAAVLDSAVFDPATASWSVGISVHEMHARPGLTIPGVPRRER